MKDGMFVFDAVVHCQDFTDTQIRDGSDGRRVRVLREQLKGFTELTATRGPAANPDFATPPDLDWANKVLFENSDTDLAMACTVPALLALEGGARSGGAELPACRLQPLAHPLHGRRRPRLPGARLRARRDGAPGQGMGRRQLQVLPIPVTRLPLACRRREDRLSALGEGARARHQDGAVPQGLSARAPARSKASSRTTSSSPPPISPTSISASTTSATPMSTRRSRSPAVSRTFIWCFPCGSTSTSCSPIPMLHRLGQALLYGGNRTHLLRVGGVHLAARPGLHRCLGRRWRCPTSCRTSTAIPP